MLRPGEIRGDADIEEELGLASLERVELFVRINQLTGVPLGSNEELLKLRTLDDLTAWVIKRS